MKRKLKKDSLPQRCEWRYYAAMGGLALMLPLLLPKAVAADNWQVEGANGVLQVRGALTESACRLEMTSARQDIWLGKPAPHACGRPAIAGCRWRSSCVCKIVCAPRPASAMRAPAR